MNNYGCSEDELNVYIFVKDHIRNEKSHFLKKYFKNYYRFAYVCAKENMTDFMKKYKYDHTAVFLTKFLVCKREDVQKRWNKRALERAVEISSTQNTTRKRRM